MNGAFEIQLAGEPFLLLPHRAVYRPQLQQLIVADLHLGKVTHFRKQGIALPAESQLKDLDRLRYLIGAWKPLTVLLLGDLFHSTYNREWLWFRSFLMDHAAISFVLLEGNHDILSNKDYELPNLRKLETLEEERFIFSHHPLANSDRINFCGHVHPGIRLEGMAKQSVTLPCFCFDGSRFLLPAFGHLTGLYLLDRDEASEYYVITGQRVVKV